MDRDEELDKQSKKYEIKHIGDFDIIANKTTPKQAEVDELMTLIEKTLQKNSGEPLVGWVSEDNYEKIGFKDRSVGPRFFAKKKWLNQQKHFSLKQSKRTRMVVQEDQRFNSLINEFMISKRVGDVVRGADFQDIAKENGFESARFVEPLVGYIDRRTGDKFVIYEYVDGVDELTRPNGNYDDEFAAQLVKKSKLIFAKKGIEATDMMEVQFIVGTTDSGITLFLTDIEGYQDLRR